ncbi:MAG TPA: glycosyltransferase family 4 protein, partial [Pyrinomonadaceae bacterium]|nr:glycosyltransferase family 4 protein [Pyrinomonadaceae bacterium]
HAKAYYSRHYSPEFSEKIEVTYTSMNPDEIDRALEAEFDRDGWREKLGIPRDAFVVITVGNFIDRKGRWTLLEAAALLNKEPAASDIYFVWLSPFLPEGEDAFRVEGYGLGGRFQVVLSDSVGTERLDVLKFFRIADVFALPSFVEGLPIALLEAMALGLPCISTNVFAIPEALKHEKTGLLIEAGDSAGLAESILKYKDEPDFRAEMAESGREYVLSHFDEREVARRVVSAYKRALDLET